MQAAFVLGWGGATYSYKIQLLVVKLSGAGPRKIIRPSIYHHPKTETKTEKGEINIDKSINNAFLKTY